MKKNIFIFIFIQVISYIIKSGISYSSSNRCESPLMYSWHDKEYVGGAHGLAGILYLLLQVLYYKSYVFWKMIHYLLFDFIILIL